MAGKKGFTLIEVVVVTLIIAALALLVAPSFKNSVMTNQMEMAKIGLVELTTAVKLYNEIHDSNPMSGIFNKDNFDLLTQEDTEQGYVYLQNSNRWGLRTGSATEYSLRTAEGVLNCRYTIGDNQDTSILSHTTCKFTGPDEDVEECYKFFIQKTNPAIVKKVRLDSCEL